MRNLLLISLSFLLFSSCAKKTSPAKSYYSIKKGKIQELTFDSNITTGYSWHCINTENEYVKFIEKKYVHPNTNLAGAPGNEVWKFEGIKKGKVTLLFEYKRSFGKVKNPKKKEIKFKVR